MATASGPKPTVTVVTVNAMAVDLSTKQFVDPYDGMSALVANTALVGVIGILGEALALAERLGLSRDAAFEVLGKTALAGQAERRRSAVESGEYPPRFALYLARKDADLILEAAAKKGLELRLTKAADEWLAEAENAGLGDKDYSAVLARILEGTSQEESSER